MRENQPKHRQLAKEKRIAERRNKSRQESATAWIVCEGKTTEPFYIESLLAYLRVNTVSVGVVSGRSDSDAVSVVKRARDRFESEPRDRVFAVIDAEQSNLAEAIQYCKEPLQLANERKMLPEIRIEPIVSNPCFEVWLLLHFRYCDQPFRNYADVESELQADIFDYFKADPRIFDKVGGGDGVQRALLHAPRLRDLCAQTGAVSPVTDMDILVKALEQIAPKN